MAMMWANPYLKCRQCGAWVQGAFDTVGPLTLDPCGHQQGYENVCHSWGPVDGCTCAPEVASAHGRPELTDRQLAHVGVKV